MASYRIGVDVGGTFTDLILLDEETGNIKTIKTSSTPRDPSIGVMNAITEALRSENGISPDRISFLAHGTTVTTNALLQSRGARTGLLLTEGFRAIYEVREQDRPPSRSMDPFYEKAPMLVPQKLTEEIPERTGFDGTIVSALDEEAVRMAVRRLRDKAVEAIAVCYLFSFMNPTNEERTAEIIQEEYPGCWVSLSNRVIPRIREYQRLSSTVLDAYVGPVLSGYVDRLRGEMEQAGLKTRQLYVMQSNGGLVTFGGATLYPCRTLLSGPAAGVIGGSYIGSTLGHSDVVSLDIGGTSADIGVISRGEVQETTEGEIDGQAISVPMIDLRTIGAGGGTIAWIGGDGLLKVGPQSAGADPGPACYSLSGTEPTVTDANLVLGYLNPAYFLGGRLKLDVHLAAAAIEKRVAAPLGMTLTEAAHGILKIINVKMEIAIRLALIEKGYDPRNFALIAFGGAGPLHAGRLAQTLHIPKVIVPLWPGLTSTMGLLVTDVRHDYLHTRVGPLRTADIALVNSMFRQMEARAQADMEREGFPLSRVEISRYLAMRYSGQAYELNVPFSQFPLAETDKDLLRREFDDIHERSYGHKAEDASVEIVNYGLVSKAEVPKLSLAQHELGGADAFITPEESRSAYFEECEGYAHVPVYRREALPVGAQFPGPAIVEQVDSTTVIYPGQRASIDAFRNLIIRVAG
ncbi:MAG: hydantoinase/oxoprolinase family protein [Chloroflexi bacterium]|nr:hydantoinase/oxoprolinase family protein [Chloroflexota bacterium]